MKEAYSSPVYYLKRDAKDWVVVIPVRGRLTPVLWKMSFACKSDAENWVASEPGRQAIQDIRGRSAQRSA